MLANIESVFQQNSSHFHVAYHRIINKEWKEYYFRYALLKSISKGYFSGESTDFNKFLEFDAAFGDEIIAVDKFVVTEITSITKLLDEVENGFNLLSAIDQKRLRDNRAERTMERILKGLYEKCTRLQQFISFNCYLIEKIAKKVEKASKRCLHDVEAKQWPSFSSYQMYTEGIQQRGPAMTSLIERVTGIYRNVFRETHGNLAAWDLAFPKDKEIHNNFIYLLLGMKIGAVITMVSRRTVTAIAPT